MTRKYINTTPNTWCPGCGNFGIQFAFKGFFEKLENEGYSNDNIVLVTGIGCHAKIADYLDVNTFYSIHGRTLPAAIAIKLANPDLRVICCAGDGDAYAEGLDHLIFAAKRDVDVTMIVHDNRVYGLTTGQYTPTSPRGYRGKSTPAGVLEDPINPLDLMLHSGATFIARGYSRQLEQLKALIRQGFDHPGFAFIDTLQVCATYNNLYDYYNARTYELSDHDPSDHAKAQEKISEWDYNSDAPIALGVFYRKEGVTPYHERALKGRKREDEVDRKAEIAKILEAKI